MGTLAVRAVKKSFHQHVEAMYSEREITLNQQVDMIGHDFHTQDFWLMFFTDLTADLFSSCCSLLSQHLPSVVFWTPDHVILARVVDIVIGLVG